MKMTVCAVYDSAVEAYGQPNVFRSEAEALRSFSDACKQSESNLAQHAQDYSFRLLGTYETNTGKFENCEIKILATAEQARHKNEVQQ